MLLDYVAPGHPMASQPSNAVTVWSQFPLQPFAPGTLTPFSYSVLAELTSRAWYLYYDRLGFEPTPRAKVVRRYKGHVYFNLSLSAQLEADHAAVEPLSLHLNGSHYPLASWEKPGFLAAFKAGRGQKKIDDTITDQARRIAAITEKARAWYLKTQSIKRWSQAEVLQIMEEIERVGVESMVAFLTARLNLGQRYGRLAASLSDKVAAAPAMLLINNALCDITGLVETEIAKSLSALAAPLADSLSNSAARTWLQAGDFANWRTELPNTMVNDAATDQIKHFIDAYGHRTVHEGEIARTRWAEDATPLLAALLAYGEGTAQTPAPTSSKSGAQQLLTMLPASARKQAEQSLEKIVELHKLQSHALHSLAYIWAGTRSWALASAREAMVDKRLHSQEEAFLFELEEIKQLMTGEWNIASLEEIRALVATRQAEHANLLQEAAPDILVNDTEAFVTHSGVPAVAGQASGPLCLWETPEAQVSAGGIVATTLLDSGCALALPFAGGFVAAAGSACDPFVAAAQAWQRPVVVGLGKTFEHLTNGAPTSIEAGVNAGEAAVKVAQN